MYKECLEEVLRIVIIAYYTIITLKPRLQKQITLII